MINIYYTSSCPYCQKVLNFIENTSLKKGEDYSLVEALRGSKERETLVELGGKSQVPFLEDTKKNTKMYESSDIIRYISDNYIK